MKKILVTIGTRLEAITVMSAVVAFMLDIASAVNVSITAQAYNPYGDGLAGGRIARILGGA